MYTNLRYIVFLLLFFYFGNYLSYAQINQLKRISEVGETKTEKTKRSKKKDINNSVLDTSQTDSTKINKEFLEANIKHIAKDYMSNDFENQTAELYNEAELYYQDIELKAGKIIIDYKNSLAYAMGIYDSLGEYIQRPVFKQGNQESVQDSLIYNFVNEKALIYNSRTEQQGMIISGNLTKRENDSTFYISKAKFTT
ncbi:MAG: LPS-assembly protein LptD, partial [Bacteroidetes bacterium]